MSLDRYTKVAAFVAAVAWGIHWTIEGVKSVVSGKKDRRQGLQEHEDRARKDCSDT